MSGTGRGYADRPAVTAVVLSLGDRPAELTRCLDSLHGQRGVELEIICVGNGWAPVDVGAGVRTKALDRNVGSPAGRNVGAESARGELLLFLDDDAWIPQRDVVARAVARFAGSPQLGALQLRVRDPDGRTLRRWVPRAWVGDPARSGPAFALAEGVTVTRRAAFEQVGGWPAAFFHGHEGVDLAWRLWDAGWDVEYAGDLVVRHPATSPARHAEFFRLNARNRVWVARRNLPALLLAVYLLSWAAITSARLVREPESLRVWWSGFVEGWRTSPGARRPMRWRTVLRLTRLGQPPVI